MGEKAGPQCPCSLGRSVGQILLLGFTDFFLCFGLGTNENAFLGWGLLQGSSRSRRDVSNILLSIRKTSNFDLSISGSFRVVLTSLYLFSV